MTGGETVTGQGQRSKKDGDKDMEMNDKQGEIRMRLPLSSSNDNIDPSRGFSLPLSFPVSSSYHDLSSVMSGVDSNIATDLQRHIVMAITNADRSPVLVSIAALIQRGINKMEFYQHTAADKTHPSPVHVQPPRLIVYRPLLSDDTPVSGYMRPSLQSLLIRDDVITRVLERVRVHSLQHVGLVAMPVASEDVLGQLSMLLATSDTDSICINSTFLHDIQQYNNNTTTNTFIPTSTNIIYRLCTTVAEATAGRRGTIMITLVETPERTKDMDAHYASSPSPMTSMRSLHMTPRPTAVSSSPADVVPTFRRQLSSNSFGTFCFDDLCCILVPIFPGIHCTYAIQIAQQLQQGIGTTAQVIYIILTSQHGQILNAEGPQSVQLVAHHDTDTDIVTNKDTAIVTATTHPDPSHHRASASASEHVLIVHEEDSQSIGLTPTLSPPVASSPSPSRSLSFLSFASASIRGRVFDAVCAQSQLRRISALVLGDYDAAAADPEVTATATASATRPSASTSVSSSPASAAGLHLVSVVV